MAPRSFTVVVRTGTRLNQLRFSRQRGEGAKAITASDWNRLLDEGQIVDAVPPDRKRGALPSTVDLEGSRTEGEVLNPASANFGRVVNDGYRSPDDPYVAPLVKTDFLWSVALKAVAAPKK